METSLTKLAAFTTAIVFASAVVLVANPTCANAGKSGGNYTVNNSKPTTVSVSQGTNFKGDASKSKKGAASGKAQFDPFKTIKN